MIRGLWAALGAAVLTLAACGGTAAPASTAAAKPSSAAASGAAVAPTRISASQNVTNNAPWWLANQAKLWEQNGLNADLQNINAQNAIKELVAGHIDGFIGGAPEVISAKAAGSPLTMVAVFGDKYDMLWTVPKDISSMDQLKGKTVGLITKSSVNGVGTVAALKKYGLQPGKDVQVVETGSAGTYSALTAALQGGHVSAAALQPDFSNKLVDSGQFRVLFDLAREPDLVSAGSTLTFQSSYVQQHPVEVQKAVDSLIKAQKYYKEHRQEAQGVLRTIFKIEDQKQLDQTYERQNELVAKDPTPRPEQFPDMLAALAEISPEVKNLDLKSLLEPRFVQDALKRGVTPT